MTTTLREFLKQHEAFINESRYTFYLIRRNTLSVVGLGIVISTVILAIDPYLFILYPASVGSYTNLSQMLLPPSIGHPFGTDDVGRDILSRVVMGFRISAIVAAISVFLGNVIGVPLGLISGYIGKLTDEVIMRITDMFLVIPSILLALVINAALGPGLQNAIIAIGVSFWPYSARIVRSQVLAIKEEGYLESARSVGATRGRIIFHHVFPNSLSVILIQSTAQIGYAILTIASLGFLGIGAQPPAPEWGLMITIGRQYWPAAWWYVTFPGIALFLTVLGYSLLGDGLRDIFDPRLRR